MSFSKGNISFRMFYPIKGWPADTLSRLNAMALPPADPKGEQVIGFTGWRHSTDVPVDDASANHGGYLHGQLVRAERKIPASLLQTQCRAEELAHMQAEQKPFVDRKTRSEIRKETMDRLLPEMPVTYAGIEFVCDARAGLVYASCTSEVQVDAVRVNFLKQLGCELLPVHAMTAAARRHNIDVREWPKASFSSEVPDAEMEEAPGQDFLTWLWFHSENQGGIINSRAVGCDMALALEGPLLFARDGNGAHETALRKGMPTVSVEARAALLSGKKLRRARLLLAVPDETWSCAFDADTFTFRGLKLPESKELLDPVSAFQQRMLKLGMFTAAIFELFDMFVAGRTSGSWAVTKEQIKVWAAGRASKR